MSAGAVVPSAAEVAPPAALARVRNGAAALGVVALVPCAVAAFFARAQFMRAWLIAELLWSGVAFGALAVLMLHHLTRGAWGLVLRRVLEATARTLPLLLVLFVPLCFGLATLYPWARPAEVAADPRLLHRAGWLNDFGWITRSALFLLAGSAAAIGLARASRRQDDGPPLDERRMRKMRVVASIGLLAYAALASLAAVDWLLSLETDWVSTAYGVLVMTGHLLSGMAFAVLAALLLARRPPFAKFIQPRHRHDWGNLLFTFVLLWAYVSFAQFLLVWSADVPVETSFYLHRQGGWLGVTVALALLRFVVPFTLLLSRVIKRRPAPLATVALLLLATQWLELLWLVAPAASPARFAVTWLDLVAPLAVGGCFVAAFAAALARAPLLPLRDPFLPEALADG